MAVLIDEDFASGIGSFTGGTHNTGEAVDFATGYLDVPVNTAVDVTFTTTSTGLLRADVWYLVDDAETIAGGSKNSAIYLMPPSLAVGSANSRAAIFIQRNTAATGVDANNIVLGYRDGGSFIDEKIIGRNRWIWISIILDMSAKTYDLRINDILWVRNIAWPNTTNADVSRIVLFNGSAAPTTHFDSVRVENSYALPIESALVIDDLTVGTAEISTTTAATDTRSINKQPWKRPDDTTTYGSLTRSATGLVPETNKNCSALIRCGPEGIFEATFTAATVLTDTYGGIILRVWAGVGTDSYLLLRYWGNGGANTIRLTQGSTVLQSGTLSGTSITAGADYDLKVEARGRYLDCYVNDVLQFSHQVVSDATGGRGQLSEEHAGILIATTAGLGDTSNRCKSFQWTGRQPDVRTTKTVGDYEFEIEGGSIREAYCADVAVANQTRNLGWSKFMQAGHRAQGDMGNYYTEEEVLLNTTNVLTTHQRSLCASEDEIMGIGECYISLYDSEIWVSDGVFVFLTTRNFAPDMDFRGDIFNKTLRGIGATGASVTEDVSGFQDFTNILAAETSPPLGFQAVTNFASGNQVRISQIIRNNVALATTPTTPASAKFEGVGDPISMAAGFDPLVTQTSYEVGRLYRLETVANATVTSDALLTALRDDVKTPATLTFTTGTAKTDAVGDLDVDGFNERFGYYEINCVAGFAEWQINGSTTTRHRPKFKLNGFTAGGQVTDGTTVQTAGVDYLLDDIGGGDAILQWLSDVTTNQTIVYEASAGGPVEITDIALTSQAVDENSAGATIGTMSSTNGDDTYSIVSDPTSKLEVSGTTLRLQAGQSYDHETDGPTFSITLRASNTGVSDYDEVFVITVNDVQEAPTGITLTSTNVPDGSASGTTVGVLGSIDPDDGDTFVYALVAGTGDTDNASFSVVSDELRTGFIADKATKETYSIRLQTTDQGGVGTAFAQQFTITVTSLGTGGANVFAVVKSVVEKFSS